VFKSGSGDRDPGSGIRAEAVGETDRIPQHGSRVPG
jgi:hypothetical protein